MKDLFEQPENIPLPVKLVLEKYEEQSIDGFDYEELDQMQAEVEQFGYTFDYYLDAVPYGLRPIGTPIESIEGYED